MGKVWVKALGIIHVEEAGHIKTVYPGNWAKVGKHQARNLIAEGTAEIPNVNTMRTIIPHNCGVVLTKDVAFSYPGIGVSYGEPKLEYDKTLIWNPDLAMNTDLLPIGFSLLDKWEMAVPISDYDLLARDIGTEEDRTLTKGFIHDLRVPVYDVRMIFMRKCIATQKFLDGWTKSPGDKRLSFLRTLYRVKPYILALPSIWCN